MRQRGIKGNIEKSIKIDNISRVSKRASELDESEKHKDSGVDSTDSTVVKEREIESQSPNRYAPNLRHPQRKSQIMTITIGIIHVKIHGTIRGSETIQAQCQDQD